VCGKTSLLHDAECGGAAFSQTSLSRAGGWAGRDWWGGIGGSWFVLFLGEIIRRAVTRFSATSFPWRSRRPADRKSKPPIRFRRKLSVCHRVSSVCHRVSSPSFRHRVSSPSFPSPSFPLHGGIIGHVHLEHGKRARIGAANARRAVHVKAAFVEMKSASSTDARGGSGDPDGAGGHWRTVALARLAWPVGALPASGSALRLER